MPSTLTGDVWKPRAPARSVRILFAGNSYTYYHSMPRMVKTMAEAAFAGISVETVFLGGGGATLREHWEERKTREAIGNGDWDFVVLQEQSMLGTGFTENGEHYFGSPEPFFRYAERFARLIREQGAEPVFYMTWSRRNRPGQQKYLTWAYMHIARETGSLVAPLGMAWEELRTNPRFDLYDDDGSHPSVHGSWLAAAMLVAVIFESGTAELPGRLEGRRILPGGALAEEPSVLSDLPESDVLVLRRAVTRLYQNQRENGGYLDVPHAVSERRPSLGTRITGVLVSAEGQAAVFLILLFCWLAARAVHRRRRQNSGR